MTDKSVFGDQMFFYAICAATKPQGTRTETRLMHLMKIFTSHQTITRTTVHRDPTPRSMPRTLTVCLIRTSTGPTLSDTLTRLKHSRQNARQLPTVGIPRSLRRRMPQILHIQNRRRRALFLRVVKNGENTGKTLFKSLSPLPSPTSPTPRVP